MPKFLGYQCSICKKEYSPNEVEYVCPSDQGNLDVIIDHAWIRKNVQAADFGSSTDASMWRYLPLLPVDDPGNAGSALRLAGGTPILKSDKLAGELGVKTLWIKDEGRNPSASFKDRASAVVVTRAKEIAAQVVVTASTGNAGAALACMAASVNQPAVIFAPRTAPAAKIAQLLVFGAQVILVDGNYDAAFDLSIEAAREFGWYCRNTGFNPFTVEGKKTAAFEIWEQLKLHKTQNGRPILIFVSVGDGNIISGIHKGFKDLYQLGWIDLVPRIFGVQSEKSAAIANAYDSGTEIITPVSATTIADSISVDYPRDGVRAIRAARETGGKYITVTDESIIAAIASLGQIGVFAEPAGSTAFAGLRAAIQNGDVQPDDEVLVMNTGSGLKDVRAAMMAVQEAPIIEPTLKALLTVLQKG